MDNLTKMFAGLQTTPVTSMGTRQRDTTAVAPAPTPKAAPKAKGSKKAPVKDHKEAWKKILKDPRVRAGILQAGLNMMAGQGLGEALGGGAAAATRSDAIATAEDTQAALLAKKLSKSTKAPATDTWVKKITDWNAANVENTAFNPLNPTAPPQAAILTPVEIQDFANYMSIIEKNFPNQSLTNPWRAYLANPALATQNLNTLLKEKNNG